MNALSRSVFAVIATIAAVGSAHAADMRVPVKAPPPAPPVIYSWSGLYIGGHIGGAKAERCLSVDQFNAEVCRDKTGWLGGGQIGYNFQTGAFVFGVEFSGSFSGLGGESRNFPNVNAQYHSDGKSLLLLTGRVGFAADRALFYITGGGAWSRNEVTLVFNNVSASRDIDRQGWTIGGGVEFAFTPNWSMAGQYNFVDLGGRSVTFPALGLSGHTSNELHVFTARLNYRFGGAAPVMARY